jgi:hypothetical protein
MKKIIVICAAFMSLSAFAESVRTGVGAFKGQLLQNAVEIKTIDVQVINQFCNFMGSTCAGGPRESETLPLITQESRDGKSMIFSHESLSQISSSNFGNRFSSCKVLLSVTGLNKIGKTLSGEATLAWINNKQTCESQVELTKVVNAALSKTLTVSDGAIYLKIQ